MSLASLLLLMSCQRIPSDEPLPFPSTDGEETGDSNGSGECEPEACTGYVDPGSVVGETGLCLSFVESSDEAGLADSSLHSGISIADFDRDGLEDIFLLNYQAPNRLFKNSGGAFTDVSAQAGLNFGGDSRAAVWSDYDGDADVDLLLAGFDGASLYRNSGGVFSHLAGAVDEPYSTGAAAWLGSGFLIATDNGTRFYENEGGDQFSADAEAKAIEVGLDDPGTGAAITLADYNGDGLDDVYLANTTGQNRLFQNLGGTYQSVEESAGAVEIGNDSSTDAEWMTLPGDSLPSIFIADYDGNNQLYRNQEDTTFTEEAGDLGIQDPGSTTSAAWEEGLSSLLFLGRWEMENLLYIPLLDESGAIEGFQNIAPALGLNDNGQTMNAEWLDYDADGDLDLAVVMYDGGLRLYQNESHEVKICGEN